MGSLTIVDTKGHSMKNESKPLVFHKCYNNPSANVVLASADDISFRVHDFYLKAASPVFRDMLSLPTKGGPIKLPNTTVDIRNLLDNLTNIEYEDVPTFQSMVEALDLAKRFDMRGIISQIKLKLHGYKDGPRLMALACQQDPIDRPLARTAFSAFKDDMHLNPDVFRLTSRHGAPDHANMKTEFLESLTTAGCYAFSQAMPECELSKDVHSRKQYDWTRVSSEFVQELDRLGR